MGLHYRSLDNERQRRDRPMMVVDWRGEEEFYRSLFRLERKVEEQSSELVTFAANWLVNDIRTSWSPTAQTQGSGNPPAIKTGNLDSSVIAEQGRDVLGRFAAARVVRVDTEAGMNPQGRGNYAQVLEFKYDLPFFQPAVDRLEAVYPSLAKRFIRL